MEIEDFKDTFKGYTVTYLREEWHNSFIEKRNAVNRKNYRFNFTISAEDLLDSEDAEPAVPAAKKTPAKEGADLAKKGGKKADKVKKSAGTDKDAPPAAPSAKIELDDSEPDSPNDAEGDL